LTIRDALEVSSDMYKKDNNNVPDYCQRHLISLPIWEELRYALQYYFFMISLSGMFYVQLGSCTSCRFWEGYFDYLMEQSSNK